jgi:uncharacterized protein involved in cysteine biosynthesis
MSNWIRTLQERIDDWIVLLTVVIVFLAVLLCVVLAAWGLVATWFAGRNCQLPFQDREICVRERAL